MYQPRRASRSEFVPIRGIRYHLRSWGEPTPGRAPLVLVHGWMDLSASWQFVVDAFARDAWILAPDWRGFGLTEAPAATDTYWFPDYFADLDALLDHVSPDAPVDLVGHSMGGNIVSFYAGARPARIRRLVVLEGFGMPATEPSEAPARYARWMDELRAQRRGEKGLKDYADAEGVAQRLQKTNPRLPADKAEWLAREWARPDARGRWKILGDPAHKVVNPQLYRVPELLAHYAAITAPTLSVEASDDSLAGWWGGRYTLADYHERLKHLPGVRQARVENAGHMLHHDQPAAVAGCIEDFVA